MIIKFHLNLLKISVRRVKNCLNRMPVPIPGKYWENLLISTVMLIMELKMQAIKAVSCRVAIMINNISHLISRSMQVQQCIRVINLPSRFHRYLTICHSRIAIRRDFSNLRSHSQIRATVIWWYRVNISQIINKTPQKLPIRLLSKTSLQEICCSRDKTKSMISLLKKLETINKLKTTTGMGDSVETYQIQSNEVIRRIWLQTKTLTKWCSKSLL